MKTSGLRRFAACWMTALGIFAADGAMRCALASGGLQSIDGTPTTQIEYYFAAGQQKVVATANATAGADPFLRIFRKSGNALIEVARNDNGAGAPNARIAFTASMSGIHVILMHAKLGTTPGKADVTIDGGTIAAASDVGGTWVTLNNLVAGEIITTLPLSRGPVQHKVFISNTAGAVTSVLTSGANQSTEHSAPANETTEHLLITAYPWVGTIFPGKIRILVNDRALPGHDPDIDGLGTELEAAAGTCSSPTEVVMGFDCSRAADPLDTDGDGLNDSEELRGQITVAPYQLLPRWGASPRHKDLFVEVDFMGKVDGEADFHMSAAVARQVWNTFSFPGVDAERRSRNAATLINPDGLPGIRTHLDTGLDPPVNAAAEDFVKFGHWGGYSHVPPDCSVSPCVGQKSENVWTSYFAPTRRGLFHYALGYTSGGGQAPAHTFRADLPINAALDFLHEFGHTLGLGHSAPYAEGNPNASVQGEMDPNCKPNFPSLMGYAYYQPPQGVGPLLEYSDGFGRDVLTNTALREKNGIANPASAESQTYLTQLRSIFGYGVDLTDGSVDWNRDGVFTANNTVRAYSNDIKGGLCEWTRYNKMHSSGKKTRSSPAIARIGDLTAVFYLNDAKQIAVLYTHSDFDCAPAANGCNGQLTAGAVTAGWNSNIDAFDVKRIVEGGHTRFLVVYRKGTRLYEATLSNAFYSTSGPLELPASNVAGEEHSLTGDDQNAFLMFRAAGDPTNGGLPLFMKRLGGTWSFEEFVIDSAGAFIGPIAPQTSPAIYYHSSNATLYGVFPVAPQGRLKFYTWNSATGRWKQSWTVDDDLHQELTVGKPAIAAMRMPAGSGFPTRVYLVWMTRSASGHTATRKTMTIGTPNRANHDVIDTSFMQPSYFDNVWNYGRGIDLMYEQGIDTNLRAAYAPHFVRDGVPVEGEIELRPFADGIVDYPLRNYDEWAYLATNLCRVLHRYECSAFPQ